MKLKYTMNLFEHLDYRSSVRWLMRNCLNYSAPVVHVGGGNAVRKNTYAGLHITRLIIYRDIIKIEKNAFLDAKAYEICYEGSPEEWALIDIEEGNELLDPSIIHFNYKGSKLDVNLPWETSEEGAANDESPDQNQ